jgi:uncharacterized protein YeaO (DUF488 family)
MILLKRIYIPYSKEDGYRILVDRLWPRGISRENAHVDLWLKDIAPSTELRKWFGHKTENWEEFKKRYMEELKLNIETVEYLKRILLEQKKVTLLFGAKDEEHNQAVVIAEFLKTHLK